MFLKLTFCSFNVLKAELTFDEKLSALNTRGFPSSVQKNVYGASVIIFEGIMSFADKELLQVRRYFFAFLFEEVLSNVKSNHRRLLPFELLKCIHTTETVGGCLLFPPAAPGYETLCGHRLRHPAGSPPPQGHHRARTGH